MSNELIYGSTKRQGHMKVERFLSEQCYFFLMSHINWFLVAKQEINVIFDSSDNCATLFVVMATHTSRTNGPGFNSSCSNNE